MIEIDVNNNRLLIVEQERPNDEVVYKTYSRDNYMLEREVIIKPSEVVDLLNVVIYARINKMTVSEYLDKLFRLEDEEESN